MKSHYKQNKHLTNSNLCINLAMKFFFLSFIQADFLLPGSGSTLQRMRVHITAKTLKKIF